MQALAPAFEIALGQHHGVLDLPRKSGEFSLDER